MHTCNVCGGKIGFSEMYHDGGYGRRAHKGCAEMETAVASGAGEHISQQAKECHTAGQGEQCL